MNLSEFKAWFEGFTENMKGAPNEKQWARIKERVSEITGESAPAPVIIREYERCRPWWPVYPRPYWGNGTLQYCNNDGTADPMPSLARTWNAIGQADYSAQA